METVANPLAGSEVPTGAPPSGATPEGLNPLAPGTTPASLSVTASSQNQEGVPQMPTVGTGIERQPAPPPAAAPGSFGQKLLKAIGGVLTGLSTAESNLGNAADPNGTGPLSGIEQTMARENAQRKEQERYDTAQREKAQERQDKLTQEQRIQQREDDESHARVAESNVRTFTARQADYRMGTEYMEKQVAQGKADLKNLEGAEVPAQVIQHGVTGDQINALLQQGKINAHEYTVIPSDLKLAGMDEQGNQKHDFLYDIVKVPDTWTPTDDQISRIKTVPGYENYMKGTVMSGAQVLSALAQADTMKATHDTMKAARAKAGIEEMTADQQQNLAQFNKNGDWLRFLNAYNGDAVSAATHMLSDKTMAQKYSTSLYNDVMGQFADGKDTTGTENFEKARHEQADEAAKRQENELKRAEANKYEGNLNLTGDAFLKTLPGTEAGLVKLAGDGKLSVPILARLIAKNPAFGQAVGAYSPDFDSAKVDGWVSAYKDYTNDKAGGVGGALNAGGAAIKGLRKLYDDTTAASLVPGSKANKDRQNDIANVAIEVAKFQAGGRQPGEKDINDVKESLDPTIPGTGGHVANPLNRKEAVKNQVDLLQKKIQEYEDNWHSKAPSPRYEAPMPNMSNEARIDAAYVLGDGSYAVPRGAQAFKDPKTNHQIFTFDGKTYYDAANGQPVNPMTPGAK